MEVHGTVSTLTFDASRGPCPRATASGDGFCVTCPDRSSQSGSGPSY
jgi:hypothetical protein